MAQAAEAERPRFHDRPEPHRAARTAGATAVQRLGSAITLSAHSHTLVSGWVFDLAGTGPGRQTTRAGDPIHDQ
jgi:hypothetical protein